MQTFTTIGTIIHGSIAFQLIGDTKCYIFGDFLVVDNCVHVSSDALSCSHTYTDLGGGSAAQEYGRWSAILRQLP